MTENQLEELFEKHSDEFLEFERIENPKHTRSDLCAMLMISEIQSRYYPEKRFSKMISWAGHEEIYLDVDVEEISEYITKQEIIDLIRCGVRFEESNFAMFV